MFQMVRVAAAAVCATAFVAAQAPVPEPAPTFKAGIEVVRLDVRVTDGSGRPIHDIKQNEIEVVENGQARPVVLFQHVEMPTAPLDEIASRTVAAEVSTNQGAPRGHLYVLIFDQQHITAGNEQRARQAAQQFLRTRIRPGDRVAAYAIPGPGPEIGFTADAARVAGELIKVRGIAEPQQNGPFGTMSLAEAYQIVRGDQATLERVAERDQQQLSSDTTRGVAAGAASFDSGISSLDSLVKEDAARTADRADQESRQVLANLADILGPMRAIEGRKTILFISEGFYDDRLSRDIERVAAAAAQSYSVIDTIDLNRRDLDIKADTPTGGDQYTNIHDQLATLGTLASETSGILIKDANSRMDEVFADIGEESQDYYLVGFTPAAADLSTPGRYQRVAVRVRRPSARVSTRTGFALQDPGSRMDRRQAIDRALAAPFPQQALRVQYTTYVLRGSTTGQARVIVSLNADLPVASSAEKRAADVVFVVRAGRDGHVAASGTDSIALPEAPPRGSTVGVGTYHVQFELPSGDYLMRAVVRAPNGLVGSADRQFTVRPLDGPSLTSGDLVVSGARGVLPVRATAYTEDGLSGVLELYGRTAAQLQDARVMVDLVPVGETLPVLSGVADLQEIGATSSGAAREARIALPLSAAVPGRYVLRATTKAGEETAARVMREVDILPGRNPTRVESDAGRAIDPGDVVAGALAHEYLDRQVREGAPTGADARKALERLASRDYASAIASLNAVLAASPKDANRWSAAATAFFLGWAYHFAGQDRDAISAWRRAAYFDPTLVPVHLALADEYVRLSQPALAIQALRAGLTALPHSPELADRLAQLERP